MATSHPRLFPLEEFHCPVACWAKNASALDEARDCFITSVVHYKCTKRKEHEFYVVHAGQPPAVLCFDRSLEVPENASPAAQAISFSLAASLSQPAKDQVFVSVNGTEENVVQRFRPCCRLRTLTFPEGAPRPSLSQLSTLLLIAGEHDYQLFARSCYWYAGVMWEVLREVYPHALIRRDEGTLRPSTWWGIYVPQSIHTRAVARRWRDGWQG